MMRPSIRLAARGGIGAVMGSKKIKAIVIDQFKMPTFHDRKKVMGAVREYGVKLGKVAAEAADAAQAVNDRSGNAP